MGVIAIRAEGLGKRFLRGTAPGGRSLKEVLYGRLRRQAAAEAHWGLRDLDVSIAAGEVVGLVGANGAGKSTLLKLIAGIMRPSAGELAVRGSVGVLLQEGTGFHPDLTARENLYLRGALLGLSRRQMAERFDRIVAFADGGEALEQPVKHLSTGTRMRLAWSVAVHTAPDVALVDEVLAVVDGAFRARCIDHLRGESARGRTAVVVSHDLSVLEDACTRILWLDHGRVVADGDDVAAMIARYRRSV